MICVVLDKLSLKHYLLASTDMIPANSILKYYYLLFREQTFIAWRWRRLRVARLLLPEEIYGRLVLLLPSLLLFFSSFFGPLTALFKILRRRTSRKNILLLLLYTYVVIDVGTRGNWNRRRVLYTDNSVFMVTIVFEYYGLFTHRVSPSFRHISPFLFLLPSAPFETQMVIKTS